MKRFIVFGTVALILLTLAGAPAGRAWAGQVTTSVIVWDSQTIVLGGLIKDTVTKIKDKVPFWGTCRWLPGSSAVNRR